MKTLSKYDAIKNCETMYRALGTDTTLYRNVENVCNLKINYFIKIKLREISSCCWACEYSKQYGYDCCGTDCIMAECWLPAHVCDGEGSIYVEFARAVRSRNYKKARRLALQIADWCKNWCEKNKKVIKRR